jgi:hypothetical protein
VPDGDAASPLDTLDAAELAAREQLLRVARGETVTPETLEMLRTLRIRAVEALLADEGELPPRSADQA